MPRLVIPAKALLSDIGHQSRAWQDIAAEYKVEIANEGDQWCIDNRIDGQGLCTEYVAPPPPPPPVVESPLPVLDKVLMDSAEASVVAITASLEASLDPAKADPTTAARLKTLEQAVALVINRLES